MAILLRVLCCVLGLTFASAAWCADDGLAESEKQLQKSYEAAVAIVKAQKPSLLKALENEQVEWLESRNRYCKEANENLPDDIDPVYAANFCKANMNRKRANILLGKPANGKKEGASF